MSPQIPRAPKRKACLIPIVSTKTSTDLTLKQPSTTVGFFWGSLSLFPWMIRLFGKHSQVRRLWWGCLPVFSCLFLCSLVFSFAFFCCLVFSCVLEEGRRAERRERGRWCVVCRVVVVAVAVVVVCLWVSVFAQKTKIMRITIRIFLLGNHFKCNFHVWTRTEKACLILISTTNNGMCVFCSSVSGCFCLIVCVCCVVVVSVVMLWCVCVAEPCFFVKLQCRNSGHSNSCGRGGVCGGFLESGSRPYLRSVGTRGWANDTQTQHRFTVRQWGCNCFDRPPTHRIFSPMGVV